jgi:hypothetical protein
MYVCMYMYVHMHECVNSHACAHETVTDMDQAASILLDIYTRLGRRMRACMYVDSLVPVFMCMN